MEDINDNQEDTLKSKYLIFNLDEENYGIEIKHVLEIISMQQITFVPETPVYIKGVINLRGKIIPVMDVRIRFKKAEKEYDDRTCVIITEIGDISVGLIVDRVMDVLNIADEDFVTNPEISTSSRNKYISAIAKVDGSVKLILDCSKIINDDDMDKVNDLAK